MKQYALMMIFTEESKALEYRRRLREHGFDCAIVVISDMREKTAIQELQESLGDVI